VRALFLLLGLTLAGCDKGCLTDWARDHGALGTGSPAGTSPAPTLEGTDCSDGLARCVGGRVEVSRAAHLTYPCTTPEGRACVCPWDEAARCATGCAEEGREVVAPADVARVQLCRPDAPVIRPVLAGDAVEPAVCDAPAVECRGGILRVCDAAGRPSRAVAVCLHGCESKVGISSDHGDSPTLDGAAAILCARLPR
jgi:hypothetical protein